jgi:hypothetical protein
MNHLLIAGAAAGAESAGDHQPVPVQRESGERQERELVDASNKAYEAEEKRKADEAAKFCRGPFRMEFASSQYKAAE